MAIMVNCPRCGQSQEVFADLLDNDFRCLSCRAIVPAKRAFDLAGFTISSDVIELIPESVARENCLLPLASKRALLHVALSDPTNRELIDKLEFILGREVKVHFAPREAVLQAIDRHYPSEPVYVQQRAATD